MDILKLIILKEMVRNKYIYYYGTKNLNYILRRIFDMNEQISKKLDDVIEKEIDDISKMTDSDKKTKAIDNLVKLHNLSIDEDKLSMDSSDKETRIKENKKDRYIKLGIEAAGLILPLAFYGIWYCKGLRFEETGTYTSTTFKNLFNHFKPTK